MAKVYQINTTVRDEFMRLTGLLVKYESAKSDGETAKAIALQARINVTKQKISNITKNAGLCVGS